MVDDTSARADPQNRRPTYRFLLAACSGLLLTALLVAGCGGGKKTTSDAPTGKFTLDAPVPVAQQTVPQAGGEVTVGSGGGPLAGMTLEVRKDAFASPRDFRVSYLPISKHTFGKDVNPVTPMIEIEYGGEVATAPMRVTIPVQTQSGHAVFAYYYDDKSGQLESLPIARRGSDSVTVTAAHFSRFFLTDVLESALLDTTADSNFRPSKDSWQFENEGSYLSPGGICSGMTLSSLYYYVNRKPIDEKQLQGRYDRNGEQPATPNLWVDDSLGVRLASIVQTDNEALWDSSLGDTLNDIATGVAVDDRLTFLAVTQGIRLTGRPQLIGIFGRDANGHSYGHSIIGYRVEGQTIYVADPNWHTDDSRTLRLKDGKFETYYSSQNAKADSAPYTIVKARGLTALANWGTAGQRWAEFDKRTVGNSTFPEVTLSVVTKTAGGAEQAVLLKDGMQVTTQTINVSTPRQQSNSNLGFIAFIDEKAVKGTESGVLASDIPLKPGPNRIGFQLLGIPPGQSALSYIDFRYVTVIFSDVQVTAAPNPAQPNAAVKFTVTMKDAPSAVRWDWDFGDGTKATNGGTSQSHAYKQEGSYTVKVTVSDIAGKQPVEAGTGQASVAVRNAPTQTLREILGSVGFSGAATDRYGTCNDTTCTRTVTYDNRLNTRLTIERKPNSASGYLNGLLTTAPSGTLGNTSTDRAPYRGLDAAHWTYVAPTSADSMLAVAKDNLLITARVSWSCQWTVGQVQAGEKTCPNPGVPSSPTANIDAILAAIAP